jgi:hypothetical protein
MNAPVFCLMLALLVLAGFYATWRAIGTLDESPSWSPGHLLANLLPDRLDLLAAQYAAPESLFYDLLRTDRFIAEADAILLVDRTLQGVGL